MSFEDDLSRVVRDARETDAARSRSLERNLRAAAAADATLSGVLLDLAERQDPLVIRTVAGRLLQGWLSLVATDALGLETGSGRVYVRLDAVASVRRGPGRAGRVDEPAGNRKAARPITFAAIVADLAGERARVALTVTGEPALVTGELRSAGAEVVTLRLDGDPPATAHLALAQVSDVTVLASG